ncbi:hypothetical protein EB796_014445 [Bugula neritina]|uniref:Tyrosine-protein phosphatase domain-containing protein n=1 Tax=Bugula neritina TaxID=10212 RepID=A0A7J7JMF0_BUGNE|nr:hypothetical protein EB796_014445 [Bugula neritina]
MESRLQNLQFKYTIAQEEDNLGKNRFLTSFLSYTSKHQFIATQLPLSNTLSNFWQLIIEQDVKVIVQLEHAEMPFFPMTDLATLSTSLHSLVRGTAEEKKHVRIIPLKFKHHKCRNFNSAAYKDNFSFNVQSLLELEKSIFILQMKAWCDTAVQYPTGALLCLCGAVDDILKKTDGSKKICVTCLFTLKNTKQCFFAVVEDYLFIYRVLKNYADSFAEYANFN